LELTPLKPTTLAFVSVRVPVTVRFESNAFEVQIFEDVTFEVVTFATVLYTGASTAPPVPTMIIELVTDPMVRLEKEALDPNTLEL
jgi:hypothetical protein